MSKYYNHKVFVVNNASTGLREEFRKKALAQAYCAENDLEYNDCVEVFDSQKELDRWDLLQIMEQRGEISDLQRQVSYVLVPSQYIKVWKTVRKKEVLKDKRVEAPITYRADFQYRLPDGKLIVEDVKSEVTRRLPEYVMKRKLMLWIHGIKLTEVL